MGVYESWVLSLGRELGRPWPDDAALTAKLEAWLVLLAAWNEKTDLTGARDARALVEVTTADALVLRDVVPEAASVLDVGAGAGAPAIPLALLRPDLRMTLLEPRARRLAFVRTSIGMLGLADRVEAFAAKIDPRSPALPRGARTADVALSRATFSPEVWAKLGLALAPRAIVLGTTPLEPVPGGAHLEREETYEWPSTHAPRWIGLLSAPAG